MSSASSEKKFKSVRRFRVGALSLIQLICLATILLGVNYLATLHVYRRDLSDDAAYTLSSSTRHYLSSEAIRGRKDPIRILMAFKHAAPFYERTRVMIEEYARLSGGRIEAEFLDPVRSPDATQKKTTEYGAVFRNTYNRTLFTRDLLVIDARTAEEIAAAAAGNRDAGKEHIRFIEAENMVQVEIQTGGTRKPAAYLGEDIVTTGLLRAVEGTARHLYFLADKSNLAEGGEGTAWGNFDGAMLSRNVQTRRINIANLAKIPDDAAGVALISPVYDFTPEELAVLQEYWERPRSALLVTVGSTETPPRLRTFLRNHGITPRRDRIVAKRGDEVSTTVPGHFVPGMDFTKDFWDKTTLFEGATCSLEVRDTGNEDLLNNRIAPYALIEAEKGYWGETNFGAGKIAFDSREDNPPPLRIAAAVIRGAATDDRFSNDVSRMVVVANSDFLDPNRFSAMHRDFLASSIDWLIGREQVTGIGPRHFGTYKLPLLDSQVSFVNRVNLFFLPALALLAGAIVWSSRRA